ncbi:hypothetical protein DQ04_00641060 [Trypanosoma grayi]|uniref:hypothetical protein n=1 Tax=Trypanosoma grayi TaxID=71804 RepID=UPI0004F49B44|nr:hypothetical protein DQ04_00641060 [Trypanosoma grayi]KEG14062.1 hypothetical protein DQ04_00641060 [Trypanosoma grayi]
MKKSISLKEFSTTPTVSYMLSKDGHNIAGALGSNNTANSGPRQPLPVATKEEKAKNPSGGNGCDTMFDME